MEKSTKLIVAFGLLILVVVGATVLVQQKSSGDSCDNVKAATYHVSITNGQVQNPNIQAKMCDKLTFTNDDALTREVAFGPHENHVPYDGVAEKFLNRGQSFTITLNATGRYHWHDHLHDSVEGYFTVSARH